MDPTFRAELEAAETVAAFDRLMIAHLAEDHPASAPPGRECVRCDKIRKYRRLAEARQAAAEAARLATADDPRR